MKVSSHIDENINEIRTIFKDDPGVIYREFRISSRADTKCFVVYVDGMADTIKINSFIIRPVMEAFQKQLHIKLGINDILNEIIPAVGVKRTSDIAEIIQGILIGNTAFFIACDDEALLINTVGWEKRPVSEPSSEKIVRGPKEGFTESLVTNIALIRKRITSPDLKFQFKVAGEVTKTNICVCYIENIAPHEIFDEVIKRLDRIKIDGILDSGYIQELIKDGTFTLFKTVGETERPDVVAAKMLEGRIAIFCDGSPFVLTVPFLFVEYFQVNEDYYNNFYFASINRIIRTIGFYITFSVPAIYVALVTFHQEMIPTPLLLSISAARQGVPFPTIVEALLMLFVFEILREAGTRIPTAVGQTISIVGALVIGQAAVEAKLVSAPIVIVAALTGISSFLIPKMEGELILLRLFHLLMSSFIGLYGYIFSFIASVVYLGTIRSFGVPYTLHGGIKSFQSQKDTVIRAPWHVMYKRPKFISSWNSDRKGKGK